MIHAILSNAHRPEYGQATVFFPIEEAEYPTVVELLRAMDLGDSVKRDCQVDELIGDWPALKCLEHGRVNLDELDYLARRLDSFDINEQAKFQASVERLGLSEMSDLINLTFCCQQATVITDFTNLEKIGRSHYIDLNGGMADPEKLDNLDGYETALLLMKNHEGTITPYGVIYDNGMQLQSLYDGQHFPEYLDRDYVLELAVTHASIPEKDAPMTYLYLPTSVERLERALCRAELNGNDEMRLYCIESNLPSEVEARLELSSESMLALNDLAKAIAPLDAEQRTKLGTAALLAEPQNVQELTALAQNLELFDYIPGIQTPAEYGKYMIQESGHFEYDPNLDAFYDYARYGQERMAQETGKFNERGYIAYRGELSLEAMLSQESGPTQEVIKM